MTRSATGCPSTRSARSTRPRICRIRRHLRGCAQCRREFAVIGEGLTHVRRAPRTTASRPPELRDRVLAVLAEEWRQDRVVVPDRPRRRERVARGGGRLHRARRRRGRGGSAPRGDAAGRDRGGDAAATADCSPPSVARSSGSASPRAVAARPASRAASCCTTRRSSSPGASCSSGRPDLTGARRRHPPRGRRTHDRAARGRARGRSAARPGSSPPTTCTRSTT